MMYTSFEEFLLAADPLRDEIFNQEGIILRAWRSGYAGGEHVGHVSLQTRRNYISLWPGGVRAEPGELEKVLRTNAVTGSRFVVNIRAEVEDEEKRVPEYTVPIFGMNSQRIDDKFEEYRQLQRNGHLRWVVSGSAFISFRKNYPEEVLHSCASFVLELLKLGGIAEYSSLALCTPPNIPITPDYVSNLAGIAGINSAIARKEILRRSPLWPNQLLLEPISAYKKYFGLSFATNDAGRVTMRTLDEIRNHPCFFEVGFVSCVRVGVELLVNPDAELKLLYRLVSRPEVLVPTTLLVSSPPMLGNLLFPYDDYDRERLELAHRGVQVVRRDVEEGGVQAVLGMASNPLGYLLSKIF